MKSSYIIIANTLSNYSKESNSMLNDSNKYDCESDSYKIFILGGCGICHSTSCAGCRG